jgi:hypothetical protein
VVLVVWSYFQGVRFFKVCGFVKCAVLQSVRFSKVCGFPKCAVFQRCAVFQSVRFFKVCGARFFKVCGFLKCAVLQSVRFFKVCGFSRCAVFGCVPPTRNCARWRYNIHQSAECGATTRSVWVGGALKTAFFRKVCRVRAGAARNFGARAAVRKQQKKPQTADVRQKNRKLRNCGCASKNRIPHSFCRGYGTTHTSRLPYHTIPHRGWPNHALLTVTPHSAE